MPPTGSAQGLQHCLFSHVNAVLMASSESRPHFVSASGIHVQAIVTNPHCCTPYVQGLLAGRNDYELLKQGGLRDINRHSYRLGSMRC